MGLFLIPIYLQSVRAEVHLLQQMEVKQELPACMVFRHRDLSVSALIVPVQVVRKKAEQEKR
ncbi:hypothetical protein KDI_56130 [Dictyobacter arantiisoli]|uniref:Uncharacterized protein n=1 Tax=Dictyobacter arantiisoli TaxID=2014874 RepID=A0A5A5TLJ7_9CHLR|nr:hypothetical protein KDI_56130 [Dictyobacter arantiisoli]